MELLDTSIANVSLPHIAGGLGTESGRFRGGLEAAADAGSLDESWRQQPVTPVYCKDFDFTGVKRALSEASKERKPEWRGTENSPGSFDNPR